LQGENDGIWAWTRFNQLFNYLPLAALIEKKIICMHGGIGRSINSVEQIEKLERPITMDAGSIILMDLLWYLFVYPSIFVIWLLVIIFATPLPILSLSVILNATVRERLPSLNPSCWA